MKTEKVPASKIAEANDLFRSTLISAHRCRVILTQGVADSFRREEIVTAVRGFKKFTFDNNPHGENDFGEVIVDGDKYFWKIDYYDENFEYGADPTEGPVCRLMTIMRADEY